MKSLLKAIRERAKARQTKSELGYGILTADRYVKTISDCVGLDVCESRYGGVAVEQVIKDAAEKLTYCNPEMELEAVANSASFKDMIDQIKLKEGEEEPELPPNTLMVFKHVLTTPKKDRDNDILRTEGAQPDPKMPLLWQHIHTLPIGKVLGIAEHTKQVLKNVTAIIDINELAHDAAVMIDNKMGRFSHGFRALDWELIEDKEGNMSGFDILKFEIMEESIVSVPSNTDAEVEDVLLTLFDRKTVKSQIVRDYIQHTYKEKRPESVMVQKAIPFGGVTVTMTLDPQDTKSCTCDEEEKATGEPDTTDLKVDDPAEDTILPKDEEGKDAEGAKEGHTTEEETKGGRTLSKKNLAKLKDVMADLKELTTTNLSRGQDALCTRCIKTLDEVIKSAGMDDEEEGEGKDADVTLKDAIGFFVEMGEQERAKHSELFKAWIAMAAREESRKTYSKLTGVSK
jgi:hypothetical protein